MKCTLDGTRICDIPSFIAELNRAVQAEAGDRADFGWELHSFHDHLHGGYGGSPPYEIIVHDAEGVISAMDHAGLVRYCDEMLKVIDAGGRGFVDEMSRRWYETQRTNAKRGEGRTLLDLLLGDITNAPATLTLLSHSGAVLVSSKDRPRETWEDDEPVEVPGADGRSRR